MNRKKTIAALKVAMRAPSKEKIRAARGRGRGRGRGAVSGVAKTPTDDDPPREDQPQLGQHRKRSAAIVLTEAQKDDIVEWIQANECLYNKGMCILLVIFSFFMKL